MPRTEETSHVPSGAHQKECPMCAIVFRTDNHRVVYCSIKCQKQAQNERYYARHRAQIIEKVLERRKE